MPTRRSASIATGVALGLALSIIAGAPVLAQRGEAPSAYPAQTAFPAANRAAVAKHLSAARRLAGDDLQPEFYWRCITSPLDKQTVFAIQHNGLVAPTKVFDQLYSVGQNAVSAWALDTPDGIILIDTLNNTDEARDIIVPNLRKVGLDPARLRYLILTHGHGDHYGGAKYLQDTYGAKVVATATDYAMMQHPGPGPFAKLTAPRLDIAAKDGDAVTLGGTTVRMYVTPGHTPGALSLIFPTTDHGVRHVVGLMGGSGGGQDAPAVHQQIRSLDRWAALTRAAGVDAIVTNHPTHMSANEKLELIRDAAPGDPNPFVYGKDKAVRFARMMEQCSRVQLARMGETGDD